MLKEEIRKKYLEKRKLLSDKELEDKNVLIAAHLTNVNLARKKYLLSYYPILQQKEVDVSRAEQEVRKQSPGLKIAWPKLSFDGVTMDALMVETDTLFVKNKHNILEPLDGEPLPPVLIDIAFVPLISFDLRGFRVGYGKGYYDRYLARCRPGVYKIGFSFFEAADLIEDIHEFDIPLNLCISPTRVYEF